MCKDEVREVGHLTRGLIPSVEGRETRLTGNGRRCASWTEVKQRSDRSTAREMGWGGREDRAFWSGRRPVVGRRDEVDDKPRKILF